MYGLKEKNLAKTYIKLIPLGVRDPDALRLVYWKKPDEKPNDSSKYVRSLLELSRRPTCVHGFPLTTVTGTKSIW